MTDFLQPDLEVQHLQQQLAQSQTALAEAQAQLKALQAKLEESKPHQPSPVPKSPSIFLNNPLKWQQIMDLLPVCIAYCDRDLYYRYVNQSYEDWFGLCPQEICGKRVADVIGQQAYQLVKPHIDRVLKGEIVTYESVVPYAQGGQRYIRATLIPDQAIDQSVHGYYAMVVDFTEHFQLEHALQESQQKYRTLFEILPVGVSIANASGQILEANPESKRILGISKEEHTQRTCDSPVWEILRSDGSPMPTEEYPSIRALREGCSIQNIEQGIVRPDGTLRWIMTSAAPIPLDPYGVAIAYIDITDRKATEEALRRSHAHYQSLANVLPQSLFREDCQGRCTFANQAFLDLLNLSDSEIFGKTVYDLYPNDLATRYNQETRWVLETGHILDVIEPHPAMSNSQEGSELSLVQVVKTPVRDSDGQIIGIQGIFWDVTERVHLERALRESEIKLNAVLSNTAAAIMSAYVFSDDSHRYDYCSAGCEDLFGYHPAEFLANHQLWLSIVHPEDLQRIVLPHFDSILAEETFQFSYRFRHRNGEWRWAMLTGTSQWESEINGWRVTKFHINITNQQRLASDLKIINDLYNLAIQSIGEGVWDWNILDDSILVSERYLELLGEEHRGIQSPQLFSEAAFSQKIHPEDQEHWEKALTAHLQSYERYDIEVRFQHAQGHYIWVRIRGQAVWNGQGEPVRMVGTIEDISDRKFAEAALNQREQEFRNLAENSPDCIMRCDREGRFLYVNRTVLQLCRIAEQDFIGKTSRELGFSEDLVQMWHEGMATVLVTGQKAFLEYEMLLPDGSHIFQSWVVPEVMQAPIFDQKYPGTLMTTPRWTSLEYLQNFMASSALNTAQLGDSATAESRSSNVMASSTVIESLLVVARDITHLKRAQIALRQQADRERTLRSITQHIQSSLNLSEILDIAVTEVHRTLQADRTFILRFHEDYSGSIIQEVVKTDYPSMRDRQWPKTNSLWSRSSTEFAPRTQIIQEIPIDRPQIHLARLMEATGAQSQVMAAIVGNLPHGESHVWGLLIVQACGNSRSWQGDEAELLQQVADQLAIAIQHSELLEQFRSQAEQLQQANHFLEEINSKLNDLSNRDGLTQIANRRCFDVVLQQEWQRCQRIQEPLSLILFDVDFFKKYNDLHGHPAGDQCLISIARSIDGLLQRNTDLVARYGGEEFVVVLPHTDSGGATQIAELIRKTVLNLQIFHSEHQGITHYVTVSLGIASQVPQLDRPCQDLVQAADRALYQAKSLGRNTWVLASDDLPNPYPSSDQD
ncbi:MAG: PAS domain S-box protein [Limnothrix sp. CACIAM 69d]|nr:MAG: PAS domain S-box protein [Limnothrix sp. CACIAM 69d]